MALQALKPQAGICFFAPLRPSQSWLATPTVVRTIRRAYADSARPRNANIPFRRAMLVDRETGKLAGPFALEAILAGRAQTKSGKFLEAAELVAEKPEPVVKYINTRDEYLRAKAQHQKERENAKTRKTKEIVMNFQLADADMAHKLKKAREALEQRCRVTVTYTNKKKAVRFTMGEMKQKVEKTIEILADVGKESKPYAILPNGSAMINLEPLAK
ncbi:hypothetical protein BC835DRAFT_1304337 [Cytidiella melzeri]|nr:hypothetical protein BC835DRAFT_1304337 [Cytidiella melzeri]